MSFSNESNLNPRIQTVITHEPQTTGGSSPEDDSHDPNKKSRFTRRQRIGAWAAGVALGVGAAVGVGVAASHNSGEATPKAVESSAPADPTTPNAEPSKDTSSEVHRYANSDFERVDELPAFLAEANEASPEKFATLPKKIQIQWATWAGQYKQQYIKQFSTVSPYSSDAEYTLTKDSDAKTLIKDRSYEQRIAENFGVGAPETDHDNGKLDADMVKKYMTAFTVATPTSLKNIDDFISNIEESTDGLSVNVDIAAAGSDYNSLEEIAKSPDYIEQPNTFGVDGEAVSGYLVHWKTEDGSKSRTFSIGAYETVDYKNQPIVVTVVEQPNE